MKLRRRAIVPLSLGLGMLGVVVAAGLTPNTGVVSAASNCTYGQCVASQPFPLWAIGISVAVVVVALLLALLLLRRRRRPGQPPSEWQGPGGPGGPSGGTPGASGPEQMAPAVGAAAVAPEVTPAWQEPPAPEPMETGPVAPAPAYVEPPAVAAPPPPVKAAPPAEPAAPEAAAEEGEPDIDSLMAELEKISGEILKKSPKKGPTPPADDADA